MGSTSIFDIQLREPVWAIGEAVCNLAENETPDQCRKRALEAAQRDAMEKAGKMILESETIVKNYQLYLDEIRTHIKAQIMEQDNDSQYGVMREIVGDNIRYVAKLRLKVQSLSTYNPYRLNLSEQLDNIVDYARDVKVDLDIKEGEWLTILNPNKKIFEVIRSDGKSYGVPAHHKNKDKNSYTLYFGKNIRWIMLIGVDSTVLKVIKIDRTTIKVI